MDLLSDDLRVHVMRQALALDYSSVGRVAPVCRLWQQLLSSWAETLFKECVLLRFCSVNRALQMEGDSRRSRFEGPHAPDPSWRKRLERFARAEDLLGHDPLMQKCCTLPNFPTARYDPSWAADSLFIEDHLAFDIAVCLEVTGQQRGQDVLLLSRAISLSDAVFQGDRILLMTCAGGLGNVVLGSGRLHLRIMLVRYRDLSIFSLTSQTYESSDLRGLCMWNLHRQLEDTCPYFNCRFNLALRETTEDWAMLNWNSKDPLPQHNIELFIYGPGECSDVKTIDEFAALVDSRFFEPLWVSGWMAAEQHAQWAFGSTTEVSMLEAGVNILSESTSAKDLQRLLSTGIVSAENASTVSMLMHHACKLLCDYEGGSDKRKAADATLAGCIPSFVKAIVSSNSLPGAAACRGHAAWALSLLCSVWHVSVDERRATTVSAGGIEALISILLQDGINVDDRNHRYACATACEALSSLTEMGGEGAKAACKALFDETGAVETLVDMIRMHDPLDANGAHAQACHVLSNLHNYTREISEGSVAALRYAKRIVGTGVIELLVEVKRAHPQHDWKFADPLYLIARLCCNEFGLNLIKDLARKRALDAGTLELLTPPTPIEREVDPTNPFRNVRMPTAMDELYEILAKLSRSQTREREGVRRWEEGGAAYSDDYDSDGDFNG